MTARPLVVLELEDERVHRITRIEDGEVRPVALPGRGPGRRAGHVLAARVKADPDADIAWLDRKRAEALGDPRDWPRLRRHDGEIVHSGTAGRDAVTASLGYVAFDSPTIRPPDPGADRGVVDAWIAPAAGCARARCLAAVGIAPAIGGFGAVLADIGLRALRLGFIPRTDPALGVAGTSPPATATEVARLIRHHHDRRWLLFWLAAGLIFERRPRPMATLAGFLTRRAGPDAPADRDAIADCLPTRGRAIDRARISALIPTLGRPRCVRQLLADLAAQTVPLTDVVIVEQLPADLDITSTAGRGSDCLELDPDTTSERAIGDLDPADWPFEIVHHRVPWTGACRARNLGLEALADTDHVLMLDDDIRVGPGFVETLLDTARAYGAESVIGAVRLPDQQPAMDAAASPPTVWPYFASGAALVARGAIDRAGGFDEAHEGGFGEDFELGLRLMARGAVVLRQPAADVVHLKAPRGGFRHPRPLPWRDAAPQPKPSPTVLYSRRAQLTRQQVDGYRLFYTLGRLRSVAPWRWPAELRRVARGWRAAESWALRLESSAGAPSGDPS